jgi:hypothetical protein
LEKIQKKAVERKMTYKLFLDDDRIPSDVIGWMHQRIGEKNPIYLQPDWIIVKNYDQFIKYIVENGLPYFVSFDHDLAFEHLAPETENWVYKEKTGFHCVKWLVEYCIDNDLQFPEYAVHSQNTIGCENMLSYIKSFLSFKK